MLSREDLVLAADTDVIVKRGIDTIRICVVPTKTNTKVMYSYGIVSVSMVWA